MPGTRLALHDRRVIAAGLAAGRSLADIARQLARPTSTVSREVIRHGGALRYDPEVAHHSTRVRTHRARPAPTVDTSSRRRSDAVGAFEQQMAAALISTGMPRQPARLLSAMHLTDSGAMTVSELEQRLDVSSASISRAVRYLSDEGMITRRRFRGSRAERYELEPEAWYRAFLSSVERNRALAETTLRGAHILGPSTPAGARLASLSAFHARLTVDIADRARHWRPSLTGGSPPGPTRSPGAGRGQTHS